MLCILRSFCPLAPPPPSILCSSFHSHPFHSLPLCCRGSCMAFHRHGELLLGNSCFQCTPIHTFILIPLRVTLRGKVICPGSRREYVPEATGLVVISSYLWIQLSTLFSTFPLKGIMEEIRFETGTVISCVNTALGGKTSSNRTDFKFTWDLGELESWLWIRQTCISNAIDLSVTDNSVRT